MLENFVFMVLLLFVNLIFIIKPIPLIAFPVALFSFYMGAIIFLYDSSIPSNPYSTVFFVLICVCNILANSLSLREKQ